MANTALLRSEELTQRASSLPVSGGESKFLELPVPALKSLLIKGLARGAMADITGLRSSGRTSLYLHILAQATAVGEVCAVIDAEDSFDPVSARAAGVKLEQVVWVRCRGNAEHALRATDLLLHAGGFGVVLLDLCEIPARVLNRIPLSYWYRFRRAVEHTPGILLVCGETPQAKSCSAAHLELKRKQFDWSGRAPFLLLRSLASAVFLRKRSVQKMELLSIPWVA